MNDSSPAAATTPDHTCVEVMSLRPELRQDLVIRCQVHGGKTFYLIEDPIAGRYSRVGVPEYTFLTLLDGSHTVADAMAATAAVMGREAINEQEAAQLIKWLVDADLAQTVASRSSDRRAEDARSAGTGDSTGWNPIFQKIPLIHPDPFVRPLAACLSPCFSAVAMIGWLALVAFGGYAIISQWDRFWSSGGEILDSQNWLWLGLSWIGLKLLHEASHAVACTVYGGKVREAGVVCILFAPLPYVDVSSVWRIEWKWKRMMVSAAGMYAELAVAAIAAIVWTTTDSPLLQQSMQNLIVMASVMTLIFNANPLMRFDGYYLLSDWIEIPNLATQSRRYLSYCFRRYVIGQSSSPPSLPDGKRAWIIGYGVLALIWRVFISLCLITAAALMFRGAGVVIAGIAVVLWAVAPLWSTLREGFAGASGGVSNPKRFALTVAGAATVFAIVLALPAPSFLRLPVAYDYDPLTDVRIRPGGFLNEVLVGPGDRVRKGQVLARFGNRELALLAEQVASDIQISRARARSFRVRGEIKAAEVEQANGQSLRAKLDDLHRQLAERELRAPASGIVTSSRLETNVGKYFAPGERVLQLGDDDRKHLLTMVTQQQAAAVRRKIGSEVTLRLDGVNGSHRSRVLDIQPRATTEVRSPSITAAGGGSIPIRAREVSRKSVDESAPYELAEPRFTVRLSAPTALSAKLRAGQTGVIAWQEVDGSIGGRLWQWLTRLSDEHAIAVQRDDAGT